MGQSICDEVDEVAHVFNVEWLSGQERPEMDRRESELPENANEALRRSAPELARSA